MHPLVPTKSSVVEVERSHSDLLFFRRVLVLKELIHLEAPSEGIATIKPRDVELNGVAVAVHGVDGGLALVCIA